MKLDDDDIVNSITIADGAELSYTMDSIDNEEDGCIECIIKGGLTANSIDEVVAPSTTQYYSMAYSDVVDGKTDRLGDYHYCQILRLGTETAVITLGTNFEVDLTKITTGDAKALTTNGAVNLKISGITGTYSRERSVYYLQPGIFSGTEFLADDYPPYRRIDNKDEIFNITPQSTVTVTLTAKESVRNLEVSKLVVNMTNVTAVDKNRFKYDFSDGTAEATIVNNSNSEDNNNNNNNNPVYDDDTGLTFNFKSATVKASKIAYDSMKDEIKDSAVVNVTAIEFDQSVTTRTYNYTNGKLVLDTTSQKDKQPVPELPTLASDTASMSVTISSTSSITGGTLKVGKDSDNNPAVEIECQLASENNAPAEAQLQIKTKMNKKDGMINAFSELTYGSIRRRTLEMTINSSNNGSGILTVIEGNAKTRKPVQLYGKTYAIDGVVGSLN